MAQTDDKVRTINLEPIGGGKITVEEASETATNIYEELKKLGKGDSERSIEIEEPEKPSFNTGKIKTYAMYIGGGIVATYLIGKALE